MLDVNISAIVQLSTIFGNLNVFHYQGTTYAFIYVLLAARGALLGASIMVTEDKKVVACAPKELSIYSFIWKKGMGKI